MTLAYGRIALIGSLDTAAMRSCPIDVDDRL
jgi:hypothetical protein